MSWSERIRSTLQELGRNRRQVKMECAARHKALAVLQAKIAEAEARLREARATFEAEPTDQNRRRALALRMTLAALKDRAARNWT